MLQKPGLKAPVFQAGDEKPFLVWGWGEGSLDNVLDMCYSSTMEKEKDININTRYPADVYTALKQFAREDGRSFHNMVIWILREYIKQRRAMSC